MNKQKFLQKYGKSYARLDLLEDHFERRTVEDIAEDVTYNAVWGLCSSSRNIERVANFIGDVEFDSYDDAISHNEISEVIDEDYVENYLYELVK